MTMNKTCKRVRLTDGYFFKVVAALKSLSLMKIYIHFTPIIITYAYLIIYHYLIMSFNCVKLNTNPNSQSLSPIPISKPQSKSHIPIPNPNPQFQFHILIPDTNRLGGWGSRGPKGPT